MLITLKAKVKSKGQKATLRVALKSCRRLSFVLPPFPFLKVLKVFSSSSCSLFKMMKPAFLTPVRKSICPSEKARWRFEYSEIFWKFFLLFRNGAPFEMIGPAWEVQKDHSANFCRAAGVRFNAGRLPGRLPAGRCESPRGRKGIARVGTEYQIPGEMPSLPHKLGLYALFLRTSQS